MLNLIIHFFSLTEIQNFRFHWYEYKILLITIREPLDPIREIRAIRFWIREFEKESAASGRDARHTDR